MKKYVIAVLIFLIPITNVWAQFPVGDKWYQNPLGFEPVSLHTRNGFLFPAAAVGLVLLLTPKDSSLQNRVSIYNSNGYSVGYKYPYTSLYQNSTGLVYKVRNWVSVGVEMDLYLPSDAYNSSLGIAIRPFARFYPIHNEKFNLYFESGGGMVYFMDNFPKPTDQDNRLGTFWNGTTKYGIGSEWKIDTKTKLLFGLQHVHVSNGNTRGAERNPSHDSNGAFIGFSRIIGRS